MRQHPLELNACVAGLVSANLPARFTSLDGTLRTAMVNSGLCCEEAANKLILSCLGRNEIALMEENIPGFNREWLTIQGAETHKEILLQPGGPPVEVSAAAADTTPLEQDSEGHVMMVDAADNLKIHEQDGHIGVYERFPQGDLKLVKEFPDRDAAEAYIEEIRQMGQASNQIGEAYSVMVRQWVIEKAEETGLEPRLVREFIGGIID